MPSLVVLLNVEPICLASFSRAMAGGEQVSYEARDIGGELDHRAVRVVDRNTRLHAVKLSVMSVLGLDVIKVLRSDRTRGIAAGVPLPASRYWRIRSGRLALQYERIERR